eukprot:30780-Pelagococcus_subviridis.AAC.1
MPPAPLLPTAASAACGASLPSSSSSSSSSRRASSRRGGVRVAMASAAPSDAHAAPSKTPPKVVILGGGVIGCSVAYFLRRVLYTGPHTTASAWCTPILKDFARRFSPPTPRFQSPTSAPFNSN